VPRTTDATPTRDRMRGGCPCICRRNDTARAIRTKPAAAFHGAATARSALRPHSEDPEAQGAASRHLRHERCRRSAAHPGLYPTKPIRWSSSGGWWTKVRAGRTPEELADKFEPTASCSNRRRFPNQVAARLAVFDFIEGCYNTDRRHSALDYLSPNQLRTEPGGRGPSLKAINRLRNRGNSSRGSGHSRTVAHRARPADPEWHSRGWEFDPPRLHFSFRVSATRRAPLPSARRRSHSRGVCARP
jgi:hypothetical protein